ncbi:MAG: hypothetical protein JWM05_3278, partial [Acidimicrobiales bacterium]|nr:hypothetical protein [Acidimicrobiales bacterium]
ERRGVEEVHRDVARLPHPLSAPVTGVVQAMLDRTSRRTGPLGPTAEVVAPGSLGAAVATGDLR